MLKGPLRRKVNNRRYSACSARLEDLDWSHWWTGRGLSGEMHILHVRHKDPEMGVHRVYCRLSDSPRLEMKAGELYWLIDRKDV